MLKLEDRQDANAELVMTMSERAKQRIEKYDDIRRIAARIVPGAEDYIELSSKNIRPQLDTEKLAV